MAGRNVQNDGNYCWQVREIFVSLGRAACRDGLSAQDILKQWDAKPASRGLGPNARGHLSDILHHYSFSNSKRGPKTPVIFHKLGENCFNLIEFVEEDAAEERDRQALQARLFVEGAPVTSEHLRRERKSKAAEEFKSGLNDLSCSVCGFDFESVYGQLGEGYIEAHHIEPLALGLRYTDTGRSFEAVCSNCHQMLHRHGLKSSDDLKEVIRQTASSA